MNTTTTKAKRDVMQRIHSDSFQRIRIIAAKRGKGMRPGVLINQILASRAATQAALDVLDEEEKAQLNKSLRP
jgi:hypothetical protein